MKNPFNQIKNIVVGHSSRLEQVKDRISEQQDKVDIKEKTEELFVKNLMRCERNTHEPSDSIKRPNL
jgi:hypothetical protein